MSFIQQFFTSRDNNANAETFVGQEGRLWWDPLTNQIYSSDGNTPGGIPLAGGGGGNGTPGGINGQVQFNQAGSFGGTANLTINSATGALSAVSFVGNGAPLTNITGANVAGTVSDATHAGVADSANSVAGGNVTGAVANATYATSAGSATTADTVTTAAQPNITSVGTLTSVSVSGNVQGGNLRTTGVVSALGRIISSGEIYSATQLTGGNISGANIVANGYLCATGNVNASGNITGNYYIGNGSLLTGITSSYGNSNVAAYLPTYSGNLAGGNLGVSGAINVTGEITSFANIVASPGGYFIGNGSTLTSITGANVTGTVANATYATSAGTATSATTAGTVTTNAQPNITSVGTLTSVTVTGNVTGGNVIGTTGVSVGGTGGDLTMTGGAITGVGNITSNGIMAINAPGGITTTQGSFDIVNATATTVNIGGSATAVNIGAITGTATINNPTIVGSQTSLTLFNTTASNVSTFGAASNLIVGATSGTMTLRNPTIVGTQTTQSLFNTVATTVNFAGAATALNIGGVGNATFSANTLVRVANTSGLALSVAGNIIGGNVLSNGQLSTAGNITGGNITVGGTMTAVGNIAASWVNAGYYTGTWGTDFVSTGNVTGTNITTAGLISAAGNITGGNILGGANVNATTHTGTTVLMSGNVTGGNVIATTTVYGNAATAFVAGTAAISGVALQMPQEGALRNLNNGSTNMYFDVSTGGSTNGQFQFRSSNAFTNVLTMSPTAFNVNTEAVVTAKTASFGRLAWNSAIDTELTVDNYRFRVSNQGGIFPQIISNTGGTVNSAWTVVAARSGSAISQAGSTGALLPNNTWTSLYTFGGMDSAGDTFVATLQDKTAGRIYRVTFMRSDNGATTGYNIIAERLI
jgi:hypothetical protein